MSELENVKLELKIEVYLDYDLMITIPFKDYVTGMVDRETGAYTFDSVKFTNAIKAFNTITDMTIDDFDLEGDRKEDWKQLGVVTIGEEFSSRIKDQMVSWIRAYILFHEPEDSEWFIFKSSEVFWTKAKTIQYEYEAGQKVTHQLTPNPIRIQYVEFGSDYIPKPSKHVKGWLFKDINHMDGTQIDYVAEPKIDPQNHVMNWGFNAVNGMLLFRQLADTYTSVNTHGKEYVDIKTNVGIGYWFGTISEEALKEFFTIVKPEETEDAL